MEPLPAGAELDGFFIEEELYNGAMARIYRARDLLTDEVVALKVPFGDIINNPVLYYHYQNEERIGRLLNHPHVVRFFYRNRSRQYIIQEYVPGVDLRKHVGRGKKINFSQARDIILQIAEALTYLHSMGVIHLDLKPENIIICHEQVKLIDFGLAVKSDLPDLLAEDFSAPHGTPFYIAPEQLVGIRDEPRSDIYSLGVIFFEMMTGHLPFPRSRKLSQTRLRLKSDPVPPRHHDPEFDSRVQEIILKSLSRLPEDRYENASMLVHDLQNIEQVQVTELGLKKKKPWWFFAQFRPPSRFSDRGNRSFFSPVDKPQLLGAVINNDSADQVVEEMRRRALVLDAEVTLLTVIEEEDDSHFLKYGLEVAGEQLRSRLEHFVQRFRRYNIDPTIRLIRGEATDVILSVAQQLQAVCIVLGPSRKPGLFGTSVVEKVTAKSKTEVLIARSKPHTLVWTAQGLPIDQLSEEQVVAIDIFLVDGWFNHVSWLAELALSLLRKSGKQMDLASDHCAVGRWLADLHKDHYWAKIAHRIDPVHNQLHKVAGEMASLAETNNLQGMKKVYQSRALQLSCGLRERFIEVSRLIREWSGYHGVNSIPVLRAADCPLFHGDAPVGGPLLELHTIRNYLESHVPEPDGLPCHGSEKKEYMDKV